MRTFKGCFFVRYVLIAALALAFCISGATAAKAMLKAR